MTKRERMPKAKWAHLNEQSYMVSRDRQRHGKVVRAWNILDGEYIVAEEFEFESGKVVRLDFENYD